MPDQPPQFLIPTIGTRGDVQPYIALASQLEKAGYQAVVATHPCMEKIVNNYHVKFAPIGPDIDIGAEAAKIRANASHWMLGFLRVMKFSFRMLEESHRDILSLAENSQVMIVSHSAAGSIEADLLNMKKISVTLFPQAIPVKDSDEPLTKRMIVGLAGWGMGLMMQRPLNRIRKRLGVSPMGPEGITSKELNLIPISSHVVPPDPRWEARHRMTGYWFAEPPKNWSPPHELEKFLAAGEPPILISLGAMALGEETHSEIIDLTLAAIEQAGVRAIIQGWDRPLALKRLPGHVFQAGSVPHTWLLPRVRAFVHHGGFGSTAAAFQAGIPALVIPHIIDQFIWGQKVEALGVGPEPIARKNLSKDNLSAALTSLTQNTAFHEKAAALGRLIQEENGLQNATSLIEDVCNEKREGE